MMSVVSYERVQRAIRSMPLAKQDAIMRRWREWLWCASDRKALRAPAEDKFKPMRPIRVHYQDGNTITTQINGTRADVLAHYVGKSFNFGDTDYGVPDRMVKAVRVEFLD